jgi:hypothetical protein
MIPVDALAQIERRRRHLRDQRHQRVKDLLVEVQRKAGERQDEQQRPGPQPGGAMDIEVGAIEAALS